MIHRITMISLISRSLQLDYQFLKLQMPLSQKSSFIIKKYIVVGKELISTVFPSSRQIQIFGKPYYYDDKFGLAVLQGTFIDNDFLKKFIPKNAVVIDVGANIGQFHLFCKKYLQAKRIYSFEPVDSTFRLLKKNCSENVFQAAVSPKSKLTFYLVDLSVWASAYQQSVKSKKIIVNGIKLDTQAKLQKEKVIDLFKIDTEGAEFDVLKVSKRIILKSRYILIEMPFESKADADILAITIFLRKFVPDIKIVRSGRIYNNDTDGTTGAADILFYNPHIVRSNKN